jgi:twitching motility protein PilT
MIPGSIQSSHQLGMHTLNEDLSRLYQMGLITRKTAIDAAYDPQDLEKVLGSSAAYY